MKLKEFKDLKVKFNGFESINKNYSESFQDIFVLQCFNGKKNGTYLEIGAGHPINGNNTYLLSDKFGWKDYQLIMVMMIGMMMLLLLQKMEKNSPVRNFKSIGIKFGLKIEE